MNDLNVQENTALNWANVLDNIASKFATTIQDRVEALTQEETLATIRGMGEITGTVLKDDEYTYVSYKGVQLIVDSRAANAFPPDMLADGMSVKFRAKRSRDYGIIAVTTWLIVS